MLLYTMSQTVKRRVPCHPCEGETGAQMHTQGIHVTVCRETLCRQVPKAADHEQQEM